MDENPYSIITKMNNDYDVITCWRNLPSNCSVPEIKHITFLHKLIGIYTIKKNLYY